MRSIQPSSDWLSRIWGKVPERGDMVNLPSGSLIVIGMDGLRVDRLRFVPSPPPTAGDEDQGRS